MRLYEISNQYNAILIELESVDGDDRLPLLKELDAISEPLEKKAVNLAKYINNVRASSSAIGAEIKRLQAMQKAIDKREQDMMDYLEFNMRQCQINKIECDLFKIQFQKNPPRVEIRDEDQVPDEYKKVKTEVSLDKLKMRDEMKLGVVIPGVELVQSEKLVIK